MSFAHLHCHTQYSVLDGAASIVDMVSKAKLDGMPAVAITDHGNMFGVFEFVNECKKQGVKPIIGCEFYMVEDMHVTSFAGTGRKDKRYHQLLLAKNAEGYKNLSILCSKGYKEGLFGKYPRIDLNLLKQHKEGLIATSCCIGAIIPQTILEKGETAGEEEFKKWLELFGDDYYLELQRHQIMNINNSGISQEDLNQILLKWSQRYNVPAICTNDSHYVEQDDAEMHDILLCVNTNNYKATPIKSDGDEEGSSRETRFGFPNDQFFFKSTNEMQHLFADVPHTVENTLQIVDKISEFSLMRDIMMPNFVLPQGYDTQQDLMRKLVYDGAKRKYGDIIPAEAIERIELELKTIFDSRFEGYFLVIEDFLREARKMDVWVGPGRGSAAGSVVAYCLDITLVDPLKYGLLFERFLNPERVSFPDIDIDFEDEGRQKVLDYVVQKYGANNVSQIITFGTMKEKSAIKDVGRVLQIPLIDVNNITKQVPDTIALKDILNDEAYKSKKDKLKPDEISKAEELKSMYAKDPQVKKILDYALKLKGNIRNTGVHACGVIIAPENLETLIPLSKAKEGLMYVTQFDNRFVEKAGLLKMDFLGLKTLNILKSAVELIKQRHGFEPKLDEIPLDDAKTFEIFKKGQTDGIFQFESPGMKKSLIGLQPDRFTDLIAMNALYRPGPIDYIPNYIARKHGTEAIEYDIDASKEILEETYGIMVYQEQVMQLSQKLANFTKGQADSLRKAMGKKVKEEMDKLYSIYIDGCIANGHNEEKAKKIWQDMEKFAQYAFNKSHSTCYALVAYQSAYLKAHYPAEFMAGLVSNNMDNIDEVGKYMQEARNMGLDVLGPSVNESSYRFKVNENGQIRFGLSAIKGVGEELVKELEIERAQRGLFHDIYDFVERLSTRVINKRVIEPLAMGGAFDCFEGLQREQYYYNPVANSTSFVEQIIKYSTSFHNINNTTSLFDQTDQNIGPDRPIPPSIPDYPVLERLNAEKQVLGMYLSGHPLDKFKKIILDTCFNNFNEFNLQHGTVYMAGMITGSRFGIDKSSKKYGKFSITNFSHTHELSLKKDNLIKYEEMVKKALYVLAKVQKKSYQPPSGEIIIYDELIELQLLEKIYDFIQKITVKIDINTLTFNLIEELKQFAINNPGKTSMYFEISDGSLAPKTEEFVGTPESFTVDPEFEIDALSEDEEEVENPASENPAENEEKPSSTPDTVEVNSAIMQNIIKVFSRKISVSITEDNISDLVQILGMDGFKIEISK